MFPVVAGRFFTGEPPGNPPPKFINKKKKSVEVFASLDSDSRQLMRAVRG